MPYLSPSPHPMDSRQVSPFSDDSSTHLRSPSTEATSVSWIHSPAEGGQKRKGDHLAHFLRKQPRLSQDSTGRRTPPARHEELIQDLGHGAENAKASSGASTEAPLNSCAGLSAHIWRRVFMYLPPKSLGHLLSVNKTFNSYLGGKNTNPGTENASGSTRRSDAEVIWTISRKLHHHHLPRPLSTHSELSMWKLIGGRSCQFCARGPGPENGHTFSPVRGPKGQGIRIYWPLGIRSCYKCLQKETFTEAELMSLNLSYLIPALSSTIVGETGRISPVPCADKQAVQPYDAISKRFLRREAQGLRDQTSSIARVFGAVAAEVWLDGLEISAAKRQRDASRWERWESNGGAKKLLLIASSPTRFSKQHKISGLNLVRLPSPSAAQSTPSFEIAQQAKNARVQEIVKRAAELSPPIHLNLLQHMPAFHAAHNIPRQLEDSEWAQLKGRFLEQKAEAERLAQVSRDTTMTPIPADCANQSETSHGRQTPTARQSQSRSPPPNRVHLFTPNNEHISAFTQPPPPHQRIISPRSYQGHQYRPPSPLPHARVTTPRVLYDKYGNEYVRTSANHHTPYVQFPPPSSARGY